MREVTEFRVLDLLRPRDCDALLGRWLVFLSFHLSDFPPEEISRGFMACKCDYDWSSILEKKWIQLSSQPFSASFPCTHAPGQNKNIKTLLGKFWCMFSVWRLLFFLIWFFVRLVVFFHKKYKYKGNLCFLIKKDWSKLSIRSNREYALDFWIKR